MKVLGGFLACWLAIVGVALGMPNDKKDASEDAGDQANTRFYNPAVAGGGFAPGVATGVVNPAFGGVVPGVTGVVNPVHGGAFNPVHGGGVVNPVHGGGFNPVHGGVGVGHPVHGVGVGHPVHGGVVNPVHGGVAGGVNVVPVAVSPVVSPVAPPASCRYWCRTPEGQAYCCEGANEAETAVVGTKPGNCPIRRPGCPPTRFGPQNCSNDYRCAGTDKCCYDTCLEQHVCKPSSYFGRK